MPVFMGLAEELERAAEILDRYTNDPKVIPYPRAVNLLRERAKTLRGERKARRGKARTVKAWVGKRRNKGNELRIKSDRIEE